MKKENINSEMDAKAYKQVCGEEWQQKCEALIDEVDVSKDHNNVFVMGKIGDSYIGNLKGNLNDVTKTVITVMVQNQIIADVILNAAETFIAHEDEIRTLVEKHFTTSKYVHRIDGKEAEDENL